MGQLYSISTQGGNWSAPYLSQRIRSAAQPMFRLRQLVDVQEAIGKGRGDSFLFDKVGNVATQGGTLVETSTIPETQYVTAQGTAQITEYGNSVPWSGKLAALGQFEVSGVTEQRLRDDQVKVLESAAGDQFAATDFVAVCSATNSVVFTTNGTAVATAGADLTASNVRSIVDYMKKKLIPKYDGRNYVCVASVAALSGMHADTGSGGWADMVKYSSPTVNKLLNGEVGEFYGVRFLEETGYLSNTIGGGTNGQAVFIGGDAVYEAVAVPEEIRLKEPKLAFA